MASKGAKITLHWLNKSRSQRILWLLEDLKVPYDLKIYHRSKEMRAPPEMKEIHPSGKAPLLTVQADGQAKPTAIAESAVITEYLVDHYGPHLIPKRYRDGCDGQVGGETESWMRHRYYTHFAEGSMMPFLVIQLIATNIKNAPIPFFLKWITGGIVSKIEGYVQPETKQQLDYIEDQLATSPENGQFLCGPSMTGADYLMSFPLLACKHFSSVTKDSHPRIWTYLEKLEAMDGYKRAVQKIIEVDGVYEAGL